MSTRQKFVWISEIKVDNFYHLEYCFHFHCYTHNVSADISFGLLQVFHVELESLHRPLNEPFIQSMGLHSSNSINYDRLKVLSYTGGNTPQDTNYTATCLLSRKLYKLDEPDMQDTAGEAGTNS